ncbi:MAG: CRISPR-associated endonuclease Cas1 [Xanthomonadaceae bacterium]|nr:CRISPR-associated endonuclease Cas1 [Xanthomonadaceae bacterium]MDP2185421.1 CRISPR-associated endonuclease Cas1 [Xanthomonadales bacterium]MDZ4116813.1 CRISPR-associated endonuclease Cas1 [Xanthomonadaceae bacterium]MDZ4379198.1 CRISPR-associated endonuclease Cas1 [Xanthomonadaceae bacterium]
MATLYLDREHVQLRLDGDALVMRNEAGERIATVPLQPLRRILVRGNVSFDSRCLGKLGERGIGVLILRGRHPRATLMLPARHHDATRRMAQYRASFDPAFCLQTARRWVDEKCERQIHYLAQLQVNRPDARLPLTRALRSLRSIRDSVGGSGHIDQLRGLEGAAARQEFQAYAALLPPSIGFAERNRRPPRDPYNAVISLAYTLLYAEAQLAAHDAGLDPAVGLYHQPAFAHEALASDLMDPERPRLNFWAQRAFAHQCLRSEDFRTSEHGCMLGKAGRARFYRSFESLTEGMRAGLRRRCQNLIAAFGLDAEAATVALDRRDTCTGEDGPDADADAAAALASDITDVAPADAGENTGDHA